MTFSSRSNPKIAASPVALTSLGAVGGARGTAAGALRIFVEFLTTYDRAAIAELESDLRNVDHAQNNSTIAEEKRQRRLTSVKNSLAEAERVVRGKLNTELRSDLKRIEDLEQSRSKRNRQQGATERAIFNQTAKSLGVTKTELDLLQTRTKLRKEEADIIQRNAQADQAQTERLRKRAQIEGQISKVQATRASLGPRLAGLAIGAVGGIVGGAVLGIGFQLADAAIQKLGDSLQDIIDPARHAKEAIADVGNEVLKLAQEQDLTLFDAATKKAEELGLANDARAKSLLEEFAQQTKVNQSIEDYVKFLEASKHPEAQRTEDIKTLANQLINTARNEGNLQTVLTGNGRATFYVADQTYYLAEATRQYDAITKQNTATIDENATAKQRLADATALARVQQEALNNALQASADAQTGKIDARIEALGDAGPSKRTKALQAQLERAQGGGGSGRSSELRNIAEERQLILLRQRLRLLGTAINLEKYSGKFLLAAIDAKIEALNKEAAAQDRVNRLLDLQFRMSKAIKRQAGESIGDFVERRAQEQRAQLTEQRDIAREAEMEKLNALKDRVQDEVALQELAQRRQEALRTQGTSNYIKNLQKQLTASEKADAKALAAKKKALEAEKAAIQKKTKEAIDLASDQATGETLAAIRGAKGFSDLIALQGRVEGLRRAKGTIEGLVKGFGIPPQIAAPFLANINKQLAAYNTKLAGGRNLEGIHPGGRGRQGLAKGGVMMLNNARSPFGSNIKLGEQGDEIGVVLSNKVAAILKDQNNGPQQVGPFYLDRSDNWLRDKASLKRLVKEAVGEALR